MKMTISERLGGNKIDVREFSEYEGREILVEFPDPHVEMTLDLEEATRLNCLLSSAIQNICYIREESKRRGN